MATMRRLAPLLLSTILACAHKGGGGPTQLRSETVKEDRAELVYELSYEPKGPRQVEIVLKMRVNGLVETNKLVAEVYMRHFNIDEGSARWDGFVPPRDPQALRVLLSIPEGIEESSATVMLSRSQDSLPLLREELTFGVGADGKVVKR